MKKNRFRYVLSASALLFSAFLVPGFLASDVRAESKVVVVKMKDIPPSYVPSKVTIKVGDTVEWRNTGKVAHTATSAAPLPDGAKPFDSGFLFSGKTFRHTFTVPGHYKVRCVPHQDMVGEVIVQP